MIVIDGAEGEGGGQVLRSALALALITGQPFRVENIRGGREKPGLMRQHLTAVEAAAAIGRAECEGADIGSSCLVFRPGRVQPGAYRFAIGTAGSTGLVLQTVLLPLVLADAPSRLVIEGGTHAMQAPPFDFLAACFLPLIRRMGAQIELRLRRHGFYPAGGGCIEVEIAPARLAPVELIERGAPISTKARALIALLDESIATRVLKAAEAGLDWPADAFAVDRLAQAPGPGLVLLLEAGFEHVTEMVSGFGQRGVTAESIGRQSAARLKGYVDSGAFAGPYLADQLLLPMALAGGGVFSTVSPTRHTLTNAAIIRRFLDRPIDMLRQADGRHLVTVSS